MPGGVFPLAESACLRRLQNLEQRLHDTVDYHSDLARRCSGQIGDASSHEWTAIVNDHLDASLILQVCYANSRAERQSPVRHSQVFRIEHIAAGCALARESVAVERNATTLLQWTRWLGFGGRGRHGRRRT